MKRDLHPEEIAQNPWARMRARRRGCRLDRFCEVGDGFDKKGILGRFSTFLEYAKPPQTGVRVTRFNALFSTGRCRKACRCSAGQRGGAPPYQDPRLWREGCPTFRQGEPIRRGVVHGTGQ